MEAVLAALEPKPGQTLFDGTLGGAGHAGLLAPKIMPGGYYLGMDRDPAALAASEPRLKATGANYRLFHGIFDAAVPVLQKAGYPQGDAVLLDLGVSSPQLDDPARGFSYRTEGPLDMRMGNTGPTAADLVNTLPEEELAAIFKTYGEERYSRRIAAAVVRERENSPITNTLRLADIVKNAMPGKGKHEDQHPARRVFQSLRVYLNGELDGLRQAIEDLLGWLRPGGAIAVITFESLSDRIVKQTLAKNYRPCQCPRDAAVCVCGKAPLIHRPQKSVTATAEEAQANPRARTARLRAAIKL